MPNAYLISQEYRGGPSTGDEPSTMINEKTSLNHGVGALETLLKRNHTKPGTVDTLYLVAEGQKGNMLLGMGLSVSNVKTLAPLKPYLVPGKDRVGCELVGINGSDVASKDLATAIAKVLGVSVKMGGNAYSPKE